MNLWNQYITPRWCIMDRCTITIIIITVRARGISTEPLLISSSSLALKSKSHFKMGLKHANRLQRDEQKQNNKKPRTPVLLETMFQKAIKMQIPAPAPPCNYAYQGEGLWIASFCLNLLVGSAKKQVGNAKVSRCNISRSGSTSHAR